MLEQKSNGKTIWPKFDISRGMIPLLMVIAIAVAVAGASFTVGVVWSDVKHDADILRSDITAIKTEVAAIRQQNDAAARDLLRFCWQAERVNSGWKCPIAFNDAFDRSKSFYPGALNPRSLPDR